MNRAPVHPHSIHSGQTVAPVKHSHHELGMAALLPHKELEIHSKDCSVRVDGISSIGIQGRTKVLQENSGVRAVAINAEDFRKMDSKTAHQTWKI